MRAIDTGKKTNDGLTVYDLDPQAAELWAVAGPGGVDPATIDPDSLPDGFRWVTSDEWESICAIKSYKFATDADSGTIQAESFEAAVEILDAMLTDDLLEDGAFGWVENLDGSRYEVNCD